MNMRFFRFLVLSAVLAVILQFTGVVGVVNAADKWTKPISIGSGGVGSSHYTIQIGCASLITRYAGISATCEATKWSAANVDLLRQGDIELSSCTSDAVYDAWRGSDYFKGKQQDFVRIYHSGYTSCCVFVTKTNSGIKKAEDLKGKRVYAWKTTSPIMMRWTLATLYAAGLTKEDVTMMDEVSTKEAVTALKEGRCDAALIVGSIPTAAVIELTSTMDCTVLPAPANVQKVLDEQFPFVIQLDLPANTYKGQTKAIKILGCKTHMICHRDLPNDLIYRVTKALMEHPDEVQAIHPAAKSVTLEGVFVKAQAPFHPGAIEYYKEVGAWTDEMEKFQVAKMAEIKK